MTTDMVLRALCDLVQDYYSFLTSLRIQSILLTFSSFFSLRTKLLSYEEGMKEFNQYIENGRPSSQIVAKGKRQGSRGTRNSPKGRASSNGALRPTSNQEDESG